MDGKTLFLGVSVRLCPVEISIWIGELSKVDSSPQCEWASSNTSRVRIEQKGRRRTNSVWAGTFIFSCPQTAVIWSLDSDWDHQLPGSQSFGLGLNYSTSFQGFLACRGQIMGYLSLHNCVSQFLYYIYVYIQIHM